MDFTFFVLGISLIYILSMLQTAFLKATDQILGSFPWPRVARFFATYLSLLAIGAVVSAIGHVIYGTPITAGSMVMPTYLISGLATIIIFSGVSLFRLPSLINVYRELDESYLLGLICMLLSAVFVVLGFFWLAG